MRNPNDIQKIYGEDAQWYQKIWTLDIKDMGWVEKTVQQVDFIWHVLELSGAERVLDMACGFGRHALELARRGCEVVGVDITPDYIREAMQQAQKQGVSAEFLCMDVRSIPFKGEFDVVLNLADGAIGYLETEAENLKIFDVIAAALKPGGKHLMDVCNGGYAAKHFPQRNWLVGDRSLSLADFEWDREHSHMYYGGLEFKYGEELTKPNVIYANPTRLYKLAELEEIFHNRNMSVQQAYGDFNAARMATDDVFQIQVYSQN